MASSKLQIEYFMLVSDIRAEQFFSFRSEVQVSEYIPFKEQHWPCLFSLLHHSREID